MMDNNYYINCAREIGDFLLSEKHELGDTLYWNSFRPGNLSDKIEAKPTLDLYSGNPGISLFFLMLYDETGEEKYLEITRKSLKWAFDKITDKEMVFGLYNGVYGLLMVTSKYIKLSDTNHFLSESNDILKKLTAKINLEDNLSGDLISGHSGSIIGLMQILEDDVLTIPEELLIYHSKCLFEFIVFRNERLFFSQEDEMPLLGFSHGQSGVAHVISQLGILYGQKWMLNLSRHLLESELEMADSKFDFPDFRSGLYFQEKFTETTFDELRIFQDDTTDMFAWCHGLPGIAMSNLMISQCFGSEQNNDLLDKFKSVFLSKFDSETIHQFCLCHGSHGNILFLIELDKIFNDEKLNDLIKKFSYQSFEQLKENGFHFEKHKHYNDLSLMNGIAGVGYYYLKLGSKNVFFDVLTPKIPIIDSNKLPNFNLNFKTFMESFVRKEFLFFEDFTIPYSKINELDILETIENSIPIEKKNFWLFQKKISKFRLYHSVDYRSFLVKEIEFSKQLIIDNVEIDYKQIVHYENNLAYKIDGTNYIYTTNGRSYQLLKVSDLEFEILSSTSPNEIIIAVLSSLSDITMIEKFKKIVDSMINAGILFLKNT